MKQLKLKNIEKPRTGRVRAIYRAGEEHEVVVFFPRYIRLGDVPNEIFLRKKGELTQEESLEEFLEGAR